MDKKILIGGGIAAAVVVVIVVVKMRRPVEEVAASAPQMMPDQSFFSALAPISGGYSSDSGGGGGSIPVIMDAGNSGSSETGGGFDMASLFKTMFETQAQTNQLGIITGGYNFDSAVLAGIVGSNGTAFVTHDANGTKITNTPGDDAYTQIVKQLYSENLGRAPELSGLTFWKNELMNKNLSVSQASAEMKNSPEYMKLIQASGQLTQSRPRPTTETTYTTSQTQNADGTTTSTQKKIQA